MAKAFLSDSNHGDGFHYTADEDGDEYDNKDMLGGLRSTGPRKHVGMNDHERYV